MKNLATIIFILISWNAFSQISYLDPLVNVTTTNFHYGKSNKELKEYKKNVWGAQAGASFQGGITNHVSLVSEFYFIMKGGQLKENNPLTIHKSTLRLYSFELPLMARFHLRNFYLNAGPSIAYNFYGKIKQEGIGPHAEGKSSLVFNGANDGFKRWDAGIQFGGGYILPFKKTRVALDVRYSYGMTNISNSAERYNRYLIVNLVFSKPWKTNPLAKKKNVPDSRNLKIN